MKDNEFCIVSAEIWWKASVKHLAHTQISFIVIILKKALELTV